MSNYPEEIYKATNESGKEWAERVYNLGRENSTTEPEWHSLTKAIQDGKKIDWERLDGVRAKCVHESDFEVTHKLERNLKYHLDHPLGWYSSGSGIIWATSLLRGWKEHPGWELFIEGEVPLKTKTAEDLSNGMCFRGYVPVGDDEIEERERLQIMVDPTYGRVVMAYDANNPLDTELYTTRSVGVIETYGIGTFKVNDETK